MKIYAGLFMKFDCEFIVAIAIYMVLHVGQSIVRRVECMCKPKEHAKQILGSSMNRTAALEVFISKHNY